MSDKELAVIPAILMVTFFFGFVFFYFVKFAFFEISSYIYFKRRGKGLIGRQEHHEIHSILSKYFQYYNKLSPEGKAKFINKLLAFKDNVDFVGRQGLKITQEMEVIVSGAAAQLTFGLEDNDTLDLEYVFVYPQKFYFKMIDKWLKGGTTESGKLLISWKDSLLGYENGSDNLNLLLHEMAHALKLSVFNNGDRDDEKLREHIYTWLHISSDEKEDIAQGEESILRKYAGVNNHEFFAVSVEHFFESPDAFKESLPDIFHHLCFTLNQDPRNVSIDYRVSEETKSKAQSIVKRISESSPFINDYIASKDWHWSLSIMLFGVFIGWALYIFLIDDINNSTQHVLLNFVIIGIGAGAIQYQKIVKSGIMSITIFMFYIYGSFTPLAYSSILLINRLAVLDVKHQEHQIKKLVFRNREVVAYVGEPLEDRDFRTFDYTEIELGNSNKENFYVLLLEFETGLLGIEYLTKKSIIIRDSPPL